MSSQNNVAKFKKRKTINIGIIVFLIMFLYIAIIVYNYFTKDKLSIYEVHEGSTAIENHITGVILREEKIVSSQKAGYITYLQKEGARVAKNEAIYSVNENGQLYNVVSNNELSISLSDKDKTEIRNDVRNFQDNFSDNKFSEVYTFKESAQNMALDIVNSTVINQGQELLADNGSTISFDTIPCEESGIISYYQDAYENITPNSVTADVFNIDKYQRTNLRKTDMLQSNSPIYKLITSETWSLILPLSKSQYELLADKDSIDFTVLEDDFKMSAALTIITKDKNYYADLTMTKYLSKYLNDRFIDVKLDFNTEEGLKIPVSSVVEKNFYQVPHDYFSLGSESQEMGLIVKTFSATGEISYKHVPTDIYYDDGAISYIDTDLFDPGTIIKKAGTSEEEIPLSQTSKLKGVYNVNLGYAVFKRIEILAPDDDYYIIDENTANGLSPYDQIALDGSTAVDQAIIY